jgi:hypothetical protein
MTRRIAVAMFSGAISLACGCSRPTQPSTVSSITITGTTFFTAVGQTSQLTATAMLTDGTSANVSARALWQSSSNAVATVTPAGVVTINGFGVADITSLYHGASGMTSVQAVPPPSLPVFNAPNAH